MANEPEKRDPKDLSEDELRELVVRLQDIVYGPDFPEEGADMMEAIYAAFRQRGLERHG